MREHRERPAFGPRPADRDPDGERTPAPILGARFGAGSGPSSAPCSDETPRALLLRVLGSEGGLGEAELEALCDRSRGVR